MRRRWTIALGTMAVLLLAPAAGPVGGQSGASGPQFSHKYRLDAPRHVVGRAKLDGIQDGTSNTFAFAEHSTHGTLRLPPDIAPPEHRAWQHSDDQPPQVLTGTVETDADGRKAIKNLSVLLHFEPARRRSGAGTARDPAAVTVAFRPDDPNQSCTSHGGCPGTAEVTYHPGGGEEPIGLLLPAIQKVRECGCPRRK